MGNETASASLGLGTAVGFGGYHGMLGQDVMDSTRELVGVCRRDRPTSQPWTDLNPVFGPAIVSRRA